MRPCPLGILEAAIGDGEPSALLKRMASLDERSGCVSGLDDHGRLSEGRHRCVARREEESVARPVLTGITHDGYLTDHEKLICDPPLKLGILRRVRGSDGCSQYRHCAAPRFDGRRMGDGIDALS